MHKNPLNLPIENIVNEYLTTDANYLDLAKKYGCNHKTIAKKLNKLGIKKKKLIVGKKNKNFTGYEEISGTYWCSLKDNAKKRNIIFDISIEYAWKIFINQNKKCNLSGRSLTLGESFVYSKYTGSLDRIDSSKGYIEGNVQWVHKDINLMKNKFNQEEFIKLCILVANYNKE